VEPPDHTRTARDTRGLARKGDEHGLSGVLREMRVAEATEIDRMDKTDATSHEFAEAGFVAFGHKGV